MNSFGTEIKAARLAKKLSLQQVAERVGTFKGYCCGIETGSLNPPSERMTRKFCRTLGLNVDRMLALAVLHKRKGASLEAISTVCYEMMQAEKELRKAAV